MTAGKKRLITHECPVCMANVEIIVEKLDFCGFVYYRCAFFRPVVYKWYNLHSKLSATILRVGISMIGLILQIYLFLLFILHSIFGVY